MAAEKTIDASSGRMLQPVLRDVGTTAWDAGPLGHRDLFGNAEEWTRGASYGSDTDSNACDVPFDVADAPGASVFPPASPTNVGHLGTILANVAAIDAATQSAFVQAGSLFRMVDVPQYYSGFRCAFPPAQ